MSEKEPSNFESEKRYWRCEKGHRAEIEPGSILDLVWQDQNKAGTSEDLLIPEGSCEQCLKENK